MRSSANHLLSEQITPQDAHPLLSALRLVLDSLKFTEQLEGELKLKEVAQQMAEMREVHEALYQRLVDLGIAPPVSNGKQLPDA